MSSGMMLDYDPYNRRAISFMLNIYPIDVRPYHNIQTLVQQTAAAGTDLAMQKPKLSYARNLPQNDCYLTKLNIFIASLAVESHMSSNHCFMPRKLAHLTATSRTKNRRLTRWISWNKSPILDECNHSCSTGLCDTWLFPHHRNLAWQVNWQSLTRGRQPMCTLDEVWRKSLSVLTTQSVLLKSLKSRIT